MPDVHSLADFDGATVVVHIHPVKFLANISLRLDPLMLHRDRLLLTKKKIFLMGNLALFCLLVLSKIGSLDLTIPSHT